MDVNIEVDGQEFEVESGQTILEAACELEIKIPTLCYLKDKNEIGACRICIVEVEGSGYQPACTFPVSDGLVIKTNSPRVRQLRRLNMELILANHPQECLQCERSTNCELQRLAKELGVEGVRFSGEVIDYELDDSTPSIVRDPNKCIQCRRCVSVCDKVQGVKALFPNHRGFETIISPAFNKSLEDVACSFCGQCIHACPVAAIKEKDNTKEVWQLLNDEKKHVVVQIAPAVRVSLGEEFGLDPGTLVADKLVTACRRLGFDKVFDTVFSADLTIMEEAHELISRLETGGSLPLLTSCSPGWIKYIEHFHNDLLPNLSTCKSPQQMFGAMAKSYYAKMKGINPEDIMVVSIMPCTAKKFEAAREEMEVDGIRDVDSVITTREFAKMIKMAGIDFLNLPGDKFDEPLGITTGAGDIFGVTGGVMEAALRTVYEKVNGDELERLEFDNVRGFAGVREAEVNLNGEEIKVAIINGLRNANDLLEAIKAGEKEYHFVEVMGCPGGCVGGGGQPIPTNEEIIAKRGNGLYSIDASKNIRKSHQNPVIEKIYENYLDNPGGSKAHDLLHTTYRSRDRY
ncbi:NADH-dependent [FeFe] hydrogenase, group A6 [Selenihalanaerobacter shriftii]|uniref:NAD(P)-dependent iron-only hydrogenase catalytic subunit n=1 Tax=Selenihalanaerobacter shriftii TaxID=142842 RepID=A0A1T4KRA0_9FIRM|nr:NADH-dependent [FeFe] hydrogenase, group A6 [Selenihalanaerobacter shriftii]SJZ44868.1 NAD(P)-dependent iron-only hydrogenase catalytic subunit [Selenihalanaerobacter shriftii]